MFASRLPFFCTSKMALPRSMSSPHEAQQLCNARAAFLTNAPRLASQFKSPEEAITAIAKILTLTLALFTC
jgi:hypothetical protein